MPKKILRNLMPTSDRAKRYSRFLKLNDDPNLFHLNRHSVSRAFAIGLGLAMLPIIGQMPLAVFLATLFRANMVLSVMLVWVSNPLTFPLLLALEYWLGTLILGRESVIQVTDMSFSQWQLLLYDIWLPLFVGASVTCTIAAVLGYGLISGFWRLHIMWSWSQRKVKNSTPRV